MTTGQILDITPEQYHQLDEFSATAAKAVIARSPLHAKAEREKEREATKQMDVGNVIHRLVLGKGKSYSVLNFADWRTNNAKEARDEARKDGLVPILAHTFETAKVAAEKIRDKLSERGFDLDGASEVAVTWDEPSEHGPVRCRAMFDHVWFSRGVILDLKVTEDASPLAIERTAENMGYAIQSAAYTRALRALFPELAGREKFLFAFCEPEDPWAANIVEPDGLFRELGERRWLRAVSAWGRCLKSNEWPGYGDGINRISPPAWALAREEEHAA